MEDIRKQLRVVIGVASHLDGMVFEQGARLPPGSLSVILADVTELATRLGHLAEDVEIRLPKRKP